MEEDAHRVESEQKDEADPISEDEGSDSQCSCLFYYCHECFPERFPGWALAENEQDKKAEKEEPEKAPASNELDNDELDNEGFEPDDRIEGIHRGGRCGRGFERRARARERARARGTSRPLQCVPLARARSASGSRVECVPAEAVRSGNAKDDSKDPAPLKVMVQWWR